MAHMLDGTGGLTSSVRTFCNSICNVVRHSSVMTSSTCQFVLQIVITFIIINVTM